MTHNILFLTTSHTELGNTGKKTGIWAEEFILPYYKFYDAGFSITVTSPLGGLLPFDPSSILKNGENKPIIERFLNDPIAQKVASSALPASGIDVTPFDVIFVPGGHGAMWDLAVNPDAIKIIEDGYDQQKLIVAICHGPAALVSAKDKAGRPIVANRRVNCFTDAEKAAVGLTDVMPFAMEARLKQLGANFEGGGNWQVFAVQDELLITGQNPGSIERVTDLVLQQLAGVSTQTLSYDYEMRV